MSKQACFFFRGMWRCAYLHGQRPRNNHGWMITLAILLLCTDLWPKRISWAMRQLVYEIASTYKTHKFAENFKELGIYSCFRMSRNCRRLGSSLASRCLEIVDSSLASQYLEIFDKTMPSNCRRSATTYPLPRSLTMEVLPRSSCSLQIICFWWCWSINDQRSAANLCIYLPYRSHQAQQQISNVWTSSGCSTT
jgi:hypothetical protein